MGLFSMAVVVVGLALLVAGVVGVDGARFDELFQPSWATDHLVYDGDLLKLKLDEYSGAGFGSKNKYLFGKVMAEIKLVPGDSAGTVTAFYMSSEGAKHHEFDFEFLGNKSGEPYLVQTNVYVNGEGNREQRMDLWFDPTADFHSYSILWNEKHVVFLVDETPIRVFKNKETEGIPFPKDQPMGIHSSIWNADDWATQGGRIKTDWSHAPFVATYRDFKVDGCVSSTTTTAAATEESGKCKSDGVNNSTVMGKSVSWWEQPSMQDLTVHQTHQLIWVRANHLVYDYCWDVDRFPVLPPECAR